jgi:hypothetical protein
MIDEARNEDAGHHVDVIEADLAQACSERSAEDNAPGPHAESDIAPRGGFPRIPSELWKLS